MKIDKSRFNDINYYNIKELLYSIMMYLYNIRNLFVTDKNIESAEKIYIIE